MPSPSAPGHPAFRPDVEGLRAVAIVAVLLSHAGVGFAAGGFVGVDVFFVISGFLITRRPRPRARPHGPISLRALLRRPRQAADAAGARRDRRGRRGRRRCCWPAARADAVAVRRDGGRRLRDELAAVGRARSTTSPAGDADRPLDHFWSLAVEEQFYVVWPLLLLAVAWRARRARAGRHGPLAALLGASRPSRSPTPSSAPPRARAGVLLGGGARVGARARRAAGAALLGGAGSGAAPRAPRHGRARPAIAVATLALGAGERRARALPRCCPSLGAVALLAAGTSAARRCRRAR